MANQKGRGRLNSIEQMPPEADGIIAWAADALRDRDQTQQDIYAEFVSKCRELMAEHRGELEFAVPSKSAFNRYSMRLATMTRRLEETREIASAISKRFDAEASDDLTLIAAEAIKTLVWEVLTAAGDSGVDPKGAMQLAAALRAATQAQTVSTTRRLKVEAEFAGQVDTAVEQVAKVKGLSADTVEAIKARILGVKS